MVNGSLLLSVSGRFGVWPHPSHCDLCLCTANPACEAVGCGQWKPPTIANPAYKGKWHAPLIDNPEYDVSGVCVWGGGGWWVQHF